MIVEINQRLSRLLYEFMGIHKNLMEDQLRVESYYKAIMEVVKKGDVVIDIGTGCGILAFISVLAGARRVYATEQARIISLADKVAKYNNLQDKTIFIKGDSRHIRLPEKADVLVSELLGHFAIDENMVNILMDARNRFLKKEGRIIPKDVELFLVPVTALNVYNEIKWGKKYGIDFSPISDVSLNMAHIITGNTRQFLAEPKKINHIDLRTIKSCNLKSTSTFEIRKAGVVHGLSGWFRSRLSDSVTINTHPDNRFPIWQNVFFPINKPIKVTRGDRVRVQFYSTSKRSTFSWKWTIALDNQ